MEAEVSWFRRWWNRLLRRRPAPVAGSLQEAYDLGETITLNGVDNLRIRDVDPNADPLSIVDRDGENILRIKANGDVTLYDRTLDRAASPEEIALLVSALVGFAQQINIPSWVWDMLCPECRARK